jgi:hypothetical protein
MRSKTPSISLNWLISQRELGLVKATRMLAPVLVMGLFIAIAAGE